MTHLFLLIFGKLLVLYSLIALGFFSGRYFKIRSEWLATLLIYIISPIVVFDVILKANLSVANLVLPILFFGLCCGICLFSFFMLKVARIRSQEQHFLSYVAGSGNTGYFGFPVVIALFGEEALSIGVLCSLGFTFFENSLGFFMAARQRHTWQESFRRVSRIPTIYAFFFAVILNLLNLSVPAFTNSIFDSFRSVYSILGMMMVGVGISKIVSLRLDWKFIELAFFAKFILWPLATIIVVFLDRFYFQSFDSVTHNIMLLMGFVPMASNTVAIAAAVKANAEKTATAVFLSTIVALFFIPLMFSIFSEN